MITKLPLLDLQEALVGSINKRIDQGYFVYNKTHVLIKFLDKTSTIGLVPNPGSHSVEMDYSGEELWQYNYSFTIRTQSHSEAKNKLFEISEYLQLLNQTKDLNSKNGSWEFDHIEFPGQPHEIQEDLQGTVMYQMDIAIFVYTK
ncbi:MAG: phage capsid protein [Lactobacillus kalixensis]|uniref:phage capsid protein n=1 Tax=Lactobacillus kalixensis TaxID=227944 RepID=UPI0039920F46